MEVYKYIEGYKSKLSLKENELAIRDIRHYFQVLLENNLHLIRVTAPLFVKSNTGINDGLNGIEKPVGFSIDSNNVNLEIVHSLAKWKRLNIGKYNLHFNEGIYTNMNAIRKDELRDNYHSIYVDQWDYEVLIKKEDRNVETLKRYVNTIYFCLKQLNEYTFKHYNIKRDLPNDITFITSEELLRLYPTLDPSSRVNEYIKKVKALFVIGIGHKLSDGISQDGRAFDYDDWNLNGDLFVYNDLLDNALELSSMGIRVDKEAIINQAILSSNEDKLNLEYQQKIINEEVPFTLGGGIGQSRLCMYFLNKLHVGEVQSSYWDDSTREFFLSKGITLL